MRILVHIGYHKTGSTFLQKIIFKNHPRVRLIDRSDMQKVFLRVDSLSFKPEVASEWFSGQMNRAKTGQDRVVISDEELSGNIHTGGNGGYVAKEVANRLFAVIPEAHIAVFIRNQYDMIESIYRQYVKKGGTFRIKKYLFDHGGYNHRFPQFSFEHLEYDKLIKYYMSRFGKDRVHIFIYEEMQNDIDAFLNNFFSELQMTPIEDFLSIDKSQVNVRLSFFSIFLARITNRFYGSDPINRRVIFHIPLFYKLCRLFYSKIDRTRCIKHLDRKHSFLDRYIREHIKEQYSESNEELGKLLKVDLSSYGYPVANVADSRSTD